MVQGGMQIDSVRMNGPGQCIARDGPRQLTKFRPPLIKILDRRQVDGQYVQMSIYTTVSNVLVNSADTYDQGLGRAVYVEQCRCPKGYTGLSCQVRNNKIYNLLIRN